MKGKYMKKAEEMPAEYRREDLGKGVRGKHFSEFADDKHEEQATEILRELGRFVVSFERLCEAMRHTVLWIFQSEGLKNQGLSQVIIGDKGSAELQVLVGALFSELQLRFGGDDQKAVKLLLKDVMALTEKRNIVIHSAWRFGTESDEAELNATAIRPRTKQVEGAVHETKIMSAQYLREQINESIRLQVIVQRLQNCIVQKGLKLSVELGKPL
jgi:hypothetical protein